MLRRGCRVKAPLIHSESDQNKEEDDKNRVGQKRVGGFLARCLRTMNLNVVFTREGRRRRKRSTSEGEEKERKIANSSLPEG